jgi:hypothetical protein
MQIQAQLKFYKTVAVPVLMNVSRMWTLTENEKKGMGAATGQHIASEPADYTYTDIHGGKNVERMAENGITEPGRRGGVERPKKIWINQE